MECIHNFYNYSWVSLYGHSPYTPSPASMAMISILNLNNREYLLNFWVAVLLRGDKLYFSALIYIFLFMSEYLVTLKMIINISFSMNSL